MTIETVDIIGYIAGFFTVINLIPQLIKIIKNKNSKNISILTYTILSLGLILWAIYGYIKSDIELIITNCISLCITISIIISIIYYKDNEKDNEKDIYLKL